MGLFDRTHTTNKLESPHNSKDSKKKIFVVGIFFVLIFAMSGLYIYSNGTTKPVNEADEESTVFESVYTSELYPEMQFGVVEGWNVNEPSDYNDDASPLGAAGAEITLTKGNTSIVISAKTLTLADYNTEEVECIQAP